MFKGKRKSDGHVAKCQCRYCVELAKKSVLVRISPDGKEIRYLHSDFMHSIISKIADLRIDRAADVYYCNKDHGWKVKMADTGLVLPFIGSTRQSAIDYEILFLEESLRIHG